MTPAFPKPVNTRRMKPGQRARKFLSRSGRPIKKRKTERRSGRVRDKAYLAWIHTQPCAAIGLSYNWNGPACHRPHDYGERMEADHVGKRGLGQKCSDRETIPLCNFAHRARTDGQHMFFGWSRQYMRAWLDEQVRIHRARYEAANQGRDAR